MLTSPAFVFAVITLLVNDFVLKQLFPGVITGKLSDFAGLFAFAVFGSAWLPARRLAVHVATGAGFAIWKSPLVQPWIDAWNSFAPMNIGRVVDASDLLALVMLPVAWLYTSRASQESSRRWRVPVIALASFAFLATSRAATVEQYDLPWTYAGSVQEFDTAARAMGVRGQPGGSHYYVDLPTDSSCVVAFFEVTAVDPQAVVRLTEIRNRCGVKPDERNRLLDLFETQVVAPLQLKPLS
jgi:hypothetical protein